MPAAKRHSARSSQGQRGSPTKDGPKSLVLVGYALPRIVAAAEQIRSFARYSLSDRALPARSTPKASQVRQCGLRCTARSATNTNTNTNTKEEDASWPYWKTQRKLRR